ncbi:MAG: FAD-binding and (Fe-S)-binding domain-containing protein [Actinomycetota bacterium]
MQTFDGAAVDSAAAARVLEALRRNGVADVRADATTRDVYSSDASLFRVRPAAVAFPHDVDEALAVLAACREAGVPLTSRGAGTSIAGNAVGPGVVLEFSRHMNRVLQLDPEARTATVQPGTVHATLQRMALAHGLRFGPDPSTHTRCTIGGMIGNNSCGARTPAYGRTVDNVEHLQLITGSGRRLRLDGNHVPDVPETGALRELAAGHLETLRTEFGRFGRQVSGYALEHLLPEKGFDLRKALVGSEGTLAVVLEAGVRLVKDPLHKTMVALGFADIGTAADVVMEVMAFSPTACEGLDRRIVDVVRSRKGPGSVPEMPAGAAWLFVELAGDHSADVADRAARLLRLPEAVDARVVDHPAESAALWKIREDGSALSGRSPAGEPAHSGWEDAAVPPERLGAYLREFDELVERHGFSGFPYGHFADGCVHVRLDFPFGNRGPNETDGRTEYRAFMSDAADLVARYGGSLSGEHGDGRVRGELLPRIYSPEAIRLFGTVKGILDPDNLLNPGVLVAPRPLDADIRTAAAKPVRIPLGFSYQHDGGDFSRAVHRCTGIAQCRTDAATRPGMVMCPSYVATKEEKDSTRGRARALQEMILRASGGHDDGGARLNDDGGARLKDDGGARLDGDGGAGLGGAAGGSGGPAEAAPDWRSPAVHEALDLCLSCKGCLSDCPTGIDMASYKAEVLYQSYRGRLRPASHYSLGWLPRWARLASFAPTLANGLLKVPGLRHAGLRLAGVDARRGIPQFAPETFDQWFRKRNSSAAATPNGPVLLWADTFTNYFSPEIGRAAVRVLESAGYEVLVPDERLCCGLTWISTGQLDTARGILGRTVDALAAYADAGVPVLGLEPSCTAVLRSDALELLGGKALPVAQATRTLAELLAGTQGWTPPSLVGEEIVAQPHCHHHAVLGWGTDLGLLRRAGAKVQSLGGCCGLAGNFGVERGHYDVSVAVAETQLLPAVRSAGPDAVLLADGFSCRTQLTDLADRRGVHLAQLLDDASGSARAGVEAGPGTPKE